MTYDRDKLQDELNAMQDMLDGVASDMHGCLRRLDHVTGAMRMLQAMILQFDAENGNAVPEVVG